jgi:NADH dehydrogenase FAD-containing subunit
VRVDEHLEVVGQERVFAIGDIADADRDMAGIASAQAKVVAENIRALIAGDGERAVYERYPPVIAVPLPRVARASFPGMTGLPGPRRSPRSRVARC